MKIAPELKKRAEKLLKDWKGERYTFGTNVLDTVGCHAARFGPRTMLVVTQYGEPGGAWMNAFTDKIIASCRDARLDFGVPVRGAGPNAPREDVYRIALSVAKRRPDSIIAVGGGSTIDAVKAASALNSYGVEDVEPLFGVDEVTKIANATGRPTIPVVAVQTAASSGAQLTKYSNLTDPVTGIKKLIVDEAIVPPAAVFDYSTTLNTPMSLTLDGALDGIAHCWEVFMGATGKCYYNEMKEMTDVATRLIVAALPIVLKKQDDLEARIALGLATDLGGYAIMIAKKNPKTGVMEKGGTNGGHLGSFQLINYLAHGRACAVLNPYYTVLFANAIEDQNRLMGPIFKDAGFIPTSVDFKKLKGKKLAIAVAEGMIAFSKKVNFPPTLKAAGVPESQIDVMITASKNPQVKMKLLNMPAPMDVDKGDVDKQMLPTLKAAFTGDLSLIP
jgi:alcohol dehydrogenase